MPSPVLPSRGAASVPSSSGAEQSPCPAHRWSRAVRPGGGSGRGCALVRSHPGSALQRRRPVVQRRGALPGTRQGWGASGLSPPHPVGLCCQCGRESPQNRACGRPTGASLMSTGCRARPSLGGQGEKPLFSVVHRGSGDGLALLAPSLLVTRQPLRERPGAARSHPHAVAPARPGQAPPECVSFSVISDSRLGFLALPVCALADRRALPCLQMLISLFSW